MRSQTIIVSCLISVALVATASAAWVPLTGEPVSISSLQGESLLFGDKVLSDITLFGTASGGAIAPDSNSVYVQGGQNSVTGDYGLRFNLSWNAAPNQTINATLSFKVSVQEGYHDYFIKDVGLDITGASANGTGVVNLGESVVGKHDFLVLVDIYARQGIFDQCTVLFFALAQLVLSLLAIRDVHPV